MADEQEPDEEMEDEDEEEQGSEGEQPDQGQVEAAMTQNEQHLQHVVACLERSVIRLSKKPWLMPRFDAATASSAGESSHQAV
jgi:hypothetical protein